MKSKIAFLGGEEKFKRILANILASNGYELRSFFSAPSLAAAVKKEMDEYSAIVIDTSKFSALPAALFPAIDSLPSILIQGKSGEGPASEEAMGPIVFDRPLSVPRLLKTLQSIASNKERVPSENSDERSVLVVDDDESFRIFVEEILKLHGYTVLSASDGIEALKVLDEGANPSTFVVDLEMPRMNGPSLIKELRKRYHTPSILIMTGTRDIELLRWGRDSAIAYALIEKPFSSRSFLRYFGKNLG